ncbi:MAG TPA: ABC transporter permease subunit [Spirochaetia bacterium]|nr:ABC transporter permease subunit [Spirochaetia bacterium]
MRSTLVRALLGVAPFFAFCLAFEIIPIVILVKESFFGDSGFTLANYAGLGERVYIASFWNSIRLSGITAILATILGTFIGYSIYRIRSRRLRNLFEAFSNVTTNFAGAPLAFAFIIVLGANGVVTVLMLQLFGLHLYPNFQIYSYAGLVVAYTYFQLPLMILLVLPSFTGLSPEWREAAVNMGASTWQYWRYIGIPLLAPSLLAGLVLLFANAYGAYATAYTLVASRLVLVTTQIAFVVTGEVLHDPGLAKAMATISLIIMGLCIAIYRIAISKARGWDK